MVANTTEAAKPPSAPIAAPAVGDATLFQVRSAAPVPLRIGVVDHYQNNQWFTPAYQPHETRTLGDGHLGAAPLTTSHAAAVSVRVVGATAGRFMPTVPGTYAVQGLPDSATYDPKVGSVRLPTAAEAGLTYQIRAWRSSPVSSKTTLAQASSDPDLPAVPAEVTKVLADAGNPSAPVARVRALRMYLFDHAQQSEPVVTSGAQLGAMSPERVVQIMGGSSATPFELVSAEALLTRWAGAAARIGYGYYNFNAQPDGSYQISFADAAAWVEVQGSDGTWLPLLDRPHRLAASSPVQLIQQVPNGARMAELAIPMHRANPVFWSSVVQYWLMVYAAIAGGLVLLWLALPLLLRSIRGIRRSRWADVHGPSGRVVVAYAALRDKAIDFRIGRPAQTPLEFLDALTPDEDHTELGWLVDRALWGDLRREITEADAANAEALVGSTLRRMCQGQTYLTRLVALGSHAALRNPWSSELPSGYPHWMLRCWPGNWRPTLRRLALGGAALVLIALPILVGVTRVPLQANEHTALPTVPASVTGGYQLNAVPEVSKTFAGQRDKSLLDDLALYDVVDSSGQTIAILQTSTFKSSLRSMSVPVRSGVLTSLGMTDILRVGKQIFYTRTFGSTTQVLWYSADKQSYHLLTATAELSKPVEFMARLVATELGNPLDEVAQITQIIPGDARAGKLGDGDDDNT